MTVNSESQGSALGAELAEALDRSLETSLHSLESLRKAVNSYTIYYRDRGVSLDRVMISVSKVLLDIELGRDGEGDDDVAPSRDSELARQLSVWCKEDYLRGS